MIQPKISNNPPPLNLKKKKKRIESFVINHHCLLKWNEH